MSGETLTQFDRIPSGASALAEGQACLQAIHTRLPGLPVYLLSFPFADDRRVTVDEELFLACVRAGGARGVLSRPVEPGDGATGVGTAGALRVRQGFVDDLALATQRMIRERQALRLERERKVLAFDTAPTVDSSQGQVTIRLRHLRLARAVGADDASEILADVERPTTRFADVVGASAAKEALGFVVDWLRQPRRYAALGVRPPRGVLLAGPPGTGKTMLARALAGETDAAFLVTSATEFVTIWQGSGPQNVRDLFARARRYAPAIVFIDEIDAVGKRRTGAAGAGRAEETTLNALLTEMDGFEANGSRPVIVVAATNLAEQLDEALQRRFDRTIEVDLPDREARLAFLRRELLGRNLSDVSEALTERLAARSAGMTIADLKRVVDAAAVLSAQGACRLNDSAVEEAFERATLGDAHALPDAETLERIARHEAGHALVGLSLGHMPLQVSIVGRGRVGGYVARDADEEKAIYTRRDLEGLICQSMAGRAAEKLFYGDDGLSTGASADLRQASAWALRMIREFGMSDEVGQLYLGDGVDGALGERACLAAERIVRSQLSRALDLLQARRPALEALIRELLARNRLSREEVERLLA